MPKMTEQKLMQQYQNFRGPLASAAQALANFQALSKDVAAANGVEYDEKVAVKLTRDSYGDALSAVKTAITASVSACRALIAEAPEKLSNGQDFKTNATAEIDRLEKAIAPLLA